MGAIAGLFVVFAALCLITAAASGCFVMLIRLMTAGLLVILVTGVLVGTPL